MGVSSKGGNESSVATTTGNSSFEQTSHEVERLLSERLLQGFCLLERACPACATPLVKQDVASAAIIDRYNLRNSSSSSSTSTSESKALQPVPGVAYCVKCRAHVVTSNADIEILERKQQRRGQILVDNNSGHPTVVVPAESCGSGASQRGLEYHGQSDGISLSRTGTATNSTSGPSLLKIGSFQLHQARARRQRLREVQQEEVSASVECDNEDQSTISTAPKPESKQEQQYNLQKLWETQQSRVHQALRAQQQQKQRPPMQEGIVVASDSTTATVQEGTVINEGTVIGTVSSDASEKSLMDNDENDEDADIQEGIVVGTEYPEDAPGQQHRSPVVPVSQKLPGNVHQMEVEEIEVVPYEEDISLLDNQTLQTYEESRLKHDDQELEPSSMYCPKTAAELEKALSHESFVDEAIKRSETAEPAISSAQTHQSQLQDFPLPDYTARRELAIKVLAAKLVHGFTISRQQCNYCSMPLLEKDDQVEKCFVCLTLRKRYLKKQGVESRSKQVVSAEEAEQRLMELAEKVGREHCFAVNKNAVENSNGLTVVQGETPPHSYAGDETGMEQEEKSSGDLQTNDDEGQQHGSNRAPSASGHESDESQFSSDRKESTTPSSEIAALKPITDLSKRPIFELLTVDAAPYRTNAKDALEETETLHPHEAKLVELIALEKQRVVDETERLEELERRRARSPPRGMQLLAFLEEETELKKAIDEAIQARNEAEKKVRRLSDEKRVLEEERILAALEKEASEKQKMAEEAMEKAREALENIKERRYKITGKSTTDKRQPALQQEENGRHVATGPSSTDLFRERWVILRAEGRSVMTRRLIAGWTLLDESCRGAECENFLLLSDGKTKHCAVCGGSGNGVDGVYATTNEAKSRKIVSIDQSSNVEVFFPTSAPPSPIDTMSLKELQEDFDTKRDIVSKEIGKRMSKGWTLLDMTCPRCVMPLMTDEKQKSEICVLCGLVGNLPRRAPAASNKKEKRFVVARTNEKNKAGSTKHDGGARAFASRSRSKSPPKLSSRDLSRTRASRSKSPPKRSTPNKSKRTSTTKTTSPNRVRSKTPTKRAVSMEQVSEKKMKTKDVEKAITAVSPTVKKSPENRKARARSISPWKRTTSNSDDSARKSKEKVEAEATGSPRSPSRLDQWKVKVAERSNSPTKKSKRNVSTLIQQMEQQLSGKWVKHTSKSSRVLKAVETQVDGEETRTQSTPQKKGEIASPDKKNYEWKWDSLQKAWRAGSPKRFQESPAASNSNAQAMDTNDEKFWTSVSPENAQSKVSSIHSKKKDTDTILKQMDPIAKGNQPKEESEKHPTATEIIRAQNKEPTEVSFEEQLRLFLDKKAKGTHKQRTPVSLFVSNAPTLSSHGSESEHEEVTNEIDHFDSTVFHDKTLMAEATEPSEGQELFDIYSYPSNALANSAKTGREATPETSKPMSSEHMYQPQKSVTVGSRPSTSRSDPPAPNGSFDGFKPSKTTRSGPPGLNGSFNSLGAARKRSPISPGGPGPQGSLERLRASRRRGGLSPGGPPAPNGSFGASQTRGPLSPGGIRVVDLREAIDQFANDFDDVVMLEAPPPTTPKQRSDKDRKDQRKSIIYIEDTMMLETPPSPTPKPIDVVVHRKTKTKNIKEPTLTESAPRLSVDVSRNNSDIAMLEIPKNFDVNSKDAIQRLIEAAMSESEGLEVSTRPRDAAGRKLASPGNSAATTPVGYTSPSSNISGSGHRSAQQSSSESKRHMERRAPSPGISAAHGAMPHSPSSNYSTRSNATGFDSSGRLSHYSQAKTSTRSEHPGKRAPSPGISTASIPVSRGSDLYAAASTASTPTGTGPRSRITPETQARSRTRKPTLTSHHARFSTKRSQNGYSQSYLPTGTHFGSDRESSHARVDHSVKSQKSTKLSGVDLASSPQESPIIDIESIRKSNWREGRDEVIIVDSPHLSDARDGGSVLDALLTRIEQEKTQDEEVPNPDPVDGKYYKQSGFIDKRSKADDEMDRIELASSDYRF